MLKLSQFLIDLINKDVDFLASQVNVQTIKNLVKILPETDRIAFETTLVDENNLDIHYNIRPSNFRIFNTFLNELSKDQGFSHENWCKVQSVLNDWKNNKSDFNRLLEGIFLEFDTSSQKSIHPPAIFFKIIENDEAALTRDFVKKLIIDLNGSLYYEKLKACLDVVYKSLPSHSSVGYLGVMLSRDIPVLRVNVYGLKKYEVKGFLKKIKWTGNENEVDFFICEIYSLLDICLLSFDIYGDRVLDKIGFEFKIKKPQIKEVRYHEIFKKLRDRGLVSKEKEKYLINCNKNWTPVRTEWHPSLVYNSLWHDLESTDQITYFLSHLKYVVSNEKSIVKAYTGICQAFKEKKIISCKERPSLEKAIEDGKNWLLGKNGQSCFWTDYFAFGSMSDVWVSGLVGSVLLILDPTLKSNQIIKEAVSTLMRQNKWGYNQCTVPDADSSIWVILFQKLACDKGWEANYDKLKVEYLTANGMVTYRESSMKNMDATWRDTHICVTASGNLLKNEFVHLIEGNKFESKWWVSDFYTSALFVLGKNKLNQDDIARLQFHLTEEVERIKQGKKINVFNLALLLISSSMINSSDKCILLDYICSQQLESGGWSGDAEMRLNDENETIIVDQNGLVTSAFAILSLNINNSNDDR